MSRRQKPSRQLSVDDQIQVMWAVSKGELSLAEAARRHGVSSATVGNWRDRRGGTWLICAVIDYAAECRLAASHTPTSRGQEASRSATPRMLCDPTRPSTNAHHARLTSPSSTAISVWRSAGPLVDWEILT
ncbi:hypothetical protein ACFPJ1_27295 [Kribbella qitaiheensis]|uniref:hypothetical protein n=1 Tax=Kribbella qitaiheensis TaxID=1544730 RepID=UPI003615BCB1